ncbi:hypothetical protein CHS0354_016694 [Potamilus streckersoni]|uniref:Uncharacterized protein n=1 Tax=Potamilus streckersoni TaxID=2493646 RepID=A0AAE0W0V8_9BIVA|nr:hypothetical protein CHS0354_016694 [Potamilus streckersoni]
MDCALLLIIVQVASGIILINPSLPEVSKTVTISCYSTVTSRNWFQNGLYKAACNSQGCVPKSVPQIGYTFTADNDKAEVTISSLNRTRDEGLWMCSSGINQSISLNVYSFPSGLFFTQGGTKEVDLSESQTILQCQTDGCMYPAPNISWYFRDISPSAIHTFYIDTRTQVTSGSCTSPEELYTSSLFLPLYTIWQNNIDKTVTLSCGIEYSDVSRNVYSQESKPVRFAVRVTEAFVQQNNQNITEILNVTIEVQVTLTCLAGTSRPPAIIVWYLGDQSKGNGSIWNFTPSAADHGGIFYCQVYNMDQNQNIDSKKARLYVRVPIDSVQLRNGTALTLYEGQLVFLICETGACRPSAAICWMKNGTDIMDSSTGVAVINIGNDLFVSTGTLTYIGKRGDNGKSLTCRAYNGLDSGRTSERLTATIYYTANITEFIPKGNISEIQENKTLELYCHVDSNPYSVISLSFGDVLISTIQDSSELIHNATAGCLDSGKYICSATNSVMNGVTVSAEVNLKIQCSPRLDHRRNISTVYYRVLNDNVTLEVNVIAYPEPTDIIWYQRGDKTDKWQQVPNQSISSSGLFSSITVHLGSPADFGDYLVNMTNSFGIYDLIFKVILESLPGIPTEFSVTERKHGSVILEWIAGYWGGHTQYFVIQYRIYHNVTWIDIDPIQEDTKAERQSFTVSGLQQKTTYEFQMYAQNKKGRSQTTKVISTTTSDSDVTRDLEDRNRIKASFVKQDAEHGKDYEGLDFTEPEASQYLQLNGITLEENRNNYLRSPESDSYEKLHPYVNNDIQMYSSLKITETSKDSERNYENT